MKVRDAMAKTFSTAHQADSVERAAELMAMEDCGFIPVLDEGRIAGVITDRDIVVQCLGKRYGDLMRETAGHVMTTGVHTIGPDDSLEDAAHEMAQYHVRRLPVVEEERLAGIPSQGHPSLTGAAPRRRPCRVVGPVRRGSPGASPPNGIAGDCR